jgi:hypothetical protein
VSSFSNDGTVINDSNLNTTNCKYGNCYTFDGGFGSNDYIRVSNDASLNNLGKVTISWWQWLNSLGAATIPVSKDGDGGFYVQENTNGQLSLRYGSASGTVGAAGDVAVGKWQHVVLKYDGSAAYAYVDGVKLASSRSGSAPSGMNDPLFIGGYGADGSAAATAYWFNGSIDELQIWKHSFSDEEIYQQYASNLQKHDSENWSLYVNQSLNATTGLTLGKYTYFGCASDDSDNENCTEMREITIEAADTTAPLINFTNPTSANASTTSDTNVTINISITEASLGSVIYNWNETNYSLLDGLLLMLNFDNISSLGENETYAVGVSNSSNHATLVNGASYNLTGKWNGAVSLDGSNDVITVPGSGLSGMAGLTLSAWVLEGADAIKPFGLWGTGGSRYIFRESGGQMQFYTNTGSGTQSISTFAPSAGWHHYVAVYNGTKMMVFKDGLKHATTVGQTGSIIAGTGTLYIGAEYDNSENQQGSIDEVRIYNRGLSDEEVELLYMSNLYKYDSDSWALYVNQTKNTTAGLAVGNYIYQAFAADSLGNLNSTEIREITIESPVTDEVYPNFGSDDYLPVNNTEFNPNTLYNFSIWINNSNGSSILQLNDVNYTSDNLTAFFHNKTFTGREAGDYSLIWGSWGNGTSENYNSSEVYYYTVKQNSSLGLGISGTTPINFGTSTNVVGSGCPDELTCSLAPSNAAHGAGTTTFNYSTAGNNNYSATSTTKDIVINQVASEVNVTLNHTEDNVTIVQGDSIYLNCSTITGDAGATLTLYNNDTIIAGGTSPLENLTTFSTIGMFNVSCLYSDSQNYTLDWENYYVNVTASGDSCGTLTESLTLSNDVSSTGTCFTIGAANVVLDCAGYNVTYAEGGSAGSPEYGVADTGGYDNVTIRNCVIKTIDGNNDDDKYGIYFSGVTDSEIINNTISTNGTLENYGIYFASNSNGNVVFNNTISPRGTEGNYGLFLEGSDYNVIENNEIATNGTTSNNLGIRLRSGADYNNISGNNISTFGLSNQGNSGMEVTSASHYNRIINNTISTFGTNANYGFYLNWDVTYNLIENNTISTGGTGNSNTGIILQFHVINNTIRGNTLSTDGTNSNNHGLFLDEGSGYFPRGNNFASNSFLTIEGKDFQMDAGVNGTVLTDQIIRSYSITGIGGIITVNNSTWGEVKYLKNVSGTGTALVGNSTSDIIFGDNLIFVNSTRNAGLNVTANLTLYGTPGDGLSNPIIAKNGVECIDCYNFTSLLAETVVFNVSGFTNYSIAETIPDTTAPYFTGISLNTTLEFLTDSLGVGFNATDETEFGTFNISDTTNFEINASGWLKNITALPTGVNYVINITINDSSNNLNNTYFMVNVTDTINATVNFTNPTLADSSEIAVDNFIVNVSSTDLGNVSTFIDFDGSLVGWWRMDDVDGSGDPVDYTGRHNGTLEGNALINSTGKLGDAAHFDGTGDFIQVSDEEALDLGYQNYTISGWIKTSVVTLQSGIYRRIINKGTYPTNGYGVYIFTDGKLSFLLDSIYGQYSASTFNSGNWEHFAISFDRSGLATFYKNGVVDGTASISSKSGVDLGGASDLYIGRYSAGNGAWMGGIDDLMIVKRLLSAAEIKGLYANTTSKYLEVNYSSLAEGAHTIKAYSQDLSGNVNQTELRTITYTALVDDEYPIFFNYTNGPANNSLYALGATYTFNVSINNTNATAGIEFDEVNYTLSNSSSVFNRTINDLAAGTYSYHYWSYGNGTDENYNSSNLQSYTVAQAGDTFTTLLNGATNNLTVTYDQQVNVTVQNNLTTATIDVNGTTFTTGQNYTLGEGVWFVNVTTAGNNNYSSNESNWYITVDSNSQSITPLLNGANANLSISFPQQINASYTGTNQSKLTIDINGTEVNIGNNYTWGVGNWVVNYSLPSKQNYSAYTTILNLEVTQTSSEVNVTLNHTEDNVTIVQGDSIYLNCSTITGDAGAILTLYNNDTIIAGGTSPLENLTTFSTIGMFNVSCLYSDSQNYTLDWENYYVNVTESEDITLPYFTGISLNTTLEFLTDSLSIGFNATDETEFGTFNISDAVNFEINASGWLKNITALPTGVNYVINITINDSSNNLNNTYFMVNVTDTINATVNFTDPTLADSAEIAVDSFIVNVSATDLGNVSTFIDFDNSLVGWWRMDDVDGSGDPVDYTGRNNGTLEGNALINSTGKMGDAVHFDGDGDYITMALPSDLNRGTPITTSFWTRDPTTNTDGMLNIHNATSITGQLMACSFLAAQNGLLCTKNKTDALGVRPNFSVNVSKWHHYVVINPGTNSQLQLYVDGVEVGETPTDSLNDFGSNVLEFGRGIIDSYGLEGDMDEILVFNRSLSATEISALYANQTTKYLEVNYSSLAEGAHTIKAYSQDLSGNVNQTELRTITYTALVDDEYSIFFNYTNGPVNNTLYSLGAAYTFNVSINNTNATAGIEFDEVNYTLSNSSSVFNRTINDLAAGTYSYHYWSYGNGTDENYNSSNLQSYTVAQAGDTFADLLNGAGSNITINFPQQINATIQGNNSQGIINVNGTTVTTGANYTFGAGVWFVNYSVVGNDNYSSNESYLYATINQASSEVNVTLNHTEDNVTIVQGDSIYLNCSTITGDAGAILTLYNNDTIIAGGTSPLENLTTFSTIGMFNVSCLYSDSQNYSLDWDNYYVNVTEVADTTAPYFTGISLNTTLEFLTDSLSIGFNATDETEFGTFAVDDDTNFVINASGYLSNNTALGIGSYELNITINDSSNNLNSSLYLVVVNDSLFPAVNFTNPTPANASEISVDNIYVNVTASDMSNVSAFIDFDNSLVGWWRMDDVNGSGDPTDYTGVNNGTAVGGASYTSSGKMGGAFEFDGDATSYVSTNLNWDFCDNNCSISLWVNPNSVRSYEGPIGLSSSADTGLFWNSNKLYFRVDNTQMNEASTLSIGTWKHIVVTKNGITGYIYEDGTFLGSGTVGATPTNANLRIGHLSSAYNFNGSIDDVMIFNRSLSADEILGLYANTTSKYLEVNYSGLAEGAHTIKAYSQDMAGNVNQTELRTVTYTALTDEEYPVFFNYTNAPANNTVYSLGATYTFNVSINNTNATAGIEFDEVNYTLSNSSSVFNRTINDLAAGTYSYHYWSYGNGTDENYNSSDLQSYTVAQAGDTFTTLLNGNSNNLTVTFDQQVNVTVQNNLTTATIDVNGTTFTTGQNYTLGEGVWFVNVTTAGNNNYSSNESNWYITVSSNTQSITPLLNGANANLSVSFPQQVNASFIGTNQSKLTIDINGTEVNIGNNYSWGVGNWVVNYSLPAKQNYSAYTTILNLEVTQTSSEVNVTLNHTENNVTIVQGDSIYLNCSTITGDAGATLTLYNNDTIIAGGISPLENLTTFSTVGMFNVSCLYSDSQNYSLDWENYWVNVTESEDTTLPYFTTIPANTTINYTQGFGVEFDADDEVGFGSFAVDDNTNFTINASGWLTNKTSNLPVATYVVNVSISDTSNNINYTFYELIVNQIVAQGSISGTTPITYGTAGDVEGLETNAGDGDVTYTLFRDNVSVSNPDIDVLGVGSYHYIYNASAGTNWSDNSSVGEFVLTVTQSAGEVYTYINNSRANFTVSNGSSTQNVYLNASLNSGSGNVELWLNGSLINNGSSPIYNQSNLSVGFYNLTAWYRGNNNYSSDFEVWWINNSGDLSPPVISGISVPVTTTTATVTFNTDESANSTVYYGLTTNTTSNTSSDSFVTSHSVGLSGLTASTKYYYNISVCDQANNCNTSLQYTFTTSAVAVEEEVVVGVGSSGGGGGGGGGGSTIIPKTDLEVDTEVIELELVLESTKERYVKITNNGAEVESGTIELEALGENVILDETSFTLSSGESKDLKITFLAGKETGIYAGKIKIKDKVILVSINVRTKALLFDSAIAVINGDKKVNKGEEELRTQITLIPMGEDPRLDVTLNYVIKDFSGKIYLQESETILVDAQKSFNKNFFVKNLEVGDYLVGLEVIYPNGVATASSQFKVVESSTVQVIVIAGGAVVVLLSLAGIGLHLRTRYKKYKRRVIK